MTVCVQLHVESTTKKRYRLDDASQKICEDLEKTDVNMRINMPVLYNKSQTLYIFTGEY